MKEGPNPKARTNVNLALWRRLRWVGGGMHGGEGMPREPAAGGGVVGKEEESLAATLRTPSRDQIRTRLGWWLGAVRALGERVIGGFKARRRPSETFFLSQ